MADPLAQLRETLSGMQTEAIGAYGDLDTMSTAELVDAMNRANTAVPAAVAACSNEIAAAVDGIVARLRDGGRMFYIGAGTAGRMGVLDASELPPTFGVAPELVSGIIAGGEPAIRSAIENAEDDREAGASVVAEHGIAAGDVLVGVSASGRTPYVLAALEAAAARGSLTIAVANNPGSAIAAVSDIAIEAVVGPELVAGSTRLNAGTAQKLVLNALSTLSMVQLGKVYGALMVDLRSTNEKLRARSERTVMAATGASAADATRVLRAADGWVKAAILMHEASCSLPEAARLLEDHSGDLRAALAAAAAGR